MNKISFILNEELISTELHPACVLLDFIRKKKRLTGTKEVCREGDCGACVVLIGELIGSEVKYKTINSCIFPLGQAQGKHIVTIEGLNQNDLTPIQKAFIDEHASQCGFCTPGFIISFTNFFLNSRDFSLDDAIEFIDGNICRCTGYKSIKRSAENLIKEFHNKIELNRNRIKSLIDYKILPAYFLQIPSKLSELRKEIQKEKKYLINSQLKQPLKEYVSIAGGTDLFVQIPDEMLEHEVHFFSDENLSSDIWEEKGECFIGANATLSDLKDSEIFQKYIPNFQKYSKLIASTPIRNQATIAGNFVNASPIGDLTIIFLALNSKLVLNNHETRREIYLSDFFKGYKILNKQPDEFIELIKIPIPPKNFKFNFEKVSRRTYLDIASVNSAFSANLNDDTLENVYLSAGGVAPIPLLLRKTSEFLNGKNVSVNTIKKCWEIASGEISPITDVRGSAEYKKLLLRQLIFAHFVQLFPDKIEFKDLL
ncbi:MAG: FAD binding domain-containing protein [Ignavibacteria bacterium]|nr:FAD binding domain-containing protein [Ignavibacteria bacterium]